MLRFPSLSSILKFAAARRRAAALLCLWAFSFALATAAAAQDFTLTMPQKFTPVAVDPGGSASAPVVLTAGTGFTGTVSLTCQVTSTISNVTLPSCQVSPPSVTPSATATVTISTTGNTTPGAYTVIVTGTGPSTTHQGSQTITVLAVNPEFTISIEDAVLPSSVHAGSGGIGTVSVNPIFGYQGTVTLSCASITPLVTVPPVCQFNYGAGNTGVVVNGTPGTAQISIITYAPKPATAIAHPRAFYALLLPLPMMLLAGIGVATSRKRVRKAWGVLALFILGGSLLLLPACSSNNNNLNNSTNPNATTPKDTYTFTLMGVDTHGNISSNTGTANQAPTVTLTVD